MDLVTFYTFLPRRLLKISEDTQAHVKALLIWTVFLAIDKMGLADFILIGLCMNNTCFDEGTYDPSWVKKMQLKEQAARLNNTFLRIATVQNPPLSSVELVDGVYKGGGIAFQFIDFLQEKYNFKYEIYMPAEDSLDANGKGVIGMLHRDEVDVAAAFLPVFPTFWEHIRYSRSLDKGEWVVLMKRPPVSATGSGLLAPFTLQVWLLIFVSLLAVGPVIYLIILLQARLCRDDEVIIYPLPSCIWFVYGALLKQGSTLSPRTDSSRLLFSTWWIFITILTAFYTANLTAFLTLSRFTLPISNLKDIGSKKYAWVSHKGSAIEESVANEIDFKTSLSGSRAEFLQENASNILEMWVKKHNYMYIGEKPIVEHLMYDDYLSKRIPSIEESDRCTYVITTWTIKDNLRAFGYSKQFPFYELFNNILEHLVEAGIVKYLLRDRLPNTQICPLDLGSKERQLQNTDLLMTYYIVAAGFVISAIAFCSELIWTHCKGNKTGQVAVARSKTEKPIKMFNTNTKSDFKIQFKDESPNVFPPPPPYHALFNHPFANSPNAKTENINGREYWVVKSVDGNTRLIPVRTPSAFLFQYTN